MCVIYIIINGFKGMYYSGCDYKHFNFVYNLNDAEVFPSRAVASQVLETIKKGNYPITHSEIVNVEYAR